MSIIGCEKIEERRFICESLTITMLKILLAILILSVNCTYNCTKKYELACCKPSCPFCGNCGLDNSNGNLSTSEYLEFGNSCCAEVILESERYCNQTIPPCILEEKLNNLDRIINFFKSGKLQLIIPVSVAIGLVALFFLYSCCIHGTKKPPLKYKHIVGRLKEIK